MLFLRERTITSTPFTRARQRVSRGQVKRMERRTLPPPRPIRAVVNNYTVSTGQQLTHGRSVPNQRGSWILQHRRHASIYEGSYEPARDSHRLVPLSEPLELNIGESRIAIDKMLRPWPMSVDVTSCTRPSRTRSAQPSSADKS